jgi:nitrogenase molybdenum-iron protein alpha/beta subunit/MoaA/NifB/PqqE/SkfB family radical SAM enzyme
VKASNKNYVNLTVNPCKMCMPMGAVTAFYGIEGCMSIIHGSQGCSTYIRRHMATHYNEPVDIASSSLTEQGTVYGGEENLIAGLKNLIQLYSPKVIGIATTCLAETIGEDVPRIIDKVAEEEFCKGVTLIPVASPGYGGTQFEGWLAATRAVVANVPLDGTPNGAVNIVTSPMSPAEHRELKRIAASFGIDCILLPDISENLDSVYAPVYKRLPQGGTKLKDIRRMGGAAFTVELGLFTQERFSVGSYLKEKFNVPFARLPMPIGLRGTDELLKLFSKLSGRPIPEELKKERGRYLDAMVDAHKYCGEGRAVIFGEPDLVYGLSRLCLECGVFPSVVATGGKCDGIAAMLGDEIARQAALQLESGYEIITESDFEKIGELTVKYGANLMIGNSDGRRVEEKTGVALVRVGFPIHDRVGGQRQMSIGYDGSLRLMDSIANTLLARREGTFREENYKKYYNDGKTARHAAVNGTDAAGENAGPKEFDMEISKKTESHPCFNCAASGNARIHLPVAPACNIQCNYCTRKFDCVNESRPGVTSEVLTPAQAVEKYLQVRAKVPRLTVVGIAGPGDALANFDTTRSTLSEIRMADSNVTFCISTNGLLLPQYAGELPGLGVSHVTVTVNAADDETGSKIYDHIDYNGQRLQGAQAASILRNNQLEGIRMLAEAGIVVKVNIVMLKGINDGQIGEIVAMVKVCGASITNIMQLIPVEGSPFEKMELVSNRELTAMRRSCEAVLPQMYHCKQCRADAIGTLGNDISIQFRNSSKAFSDGRDGYMENKHFRFAVSSKSGIFIDQHFGHTKDFYIYDCTGDEVCYIEKRQVGQYCYGIGDCGGEKPAAIEDIIGAVGDCDAVLCMRIGTEPAANLRRSGKEVLMMYDRIENGVREAVKQLIDAKEKQIPIRRSL